MQIQCFVFLLFIFSIFQKHHCILWSIFFTVSTRGISPIIYIFIKNLWYFPSKLQSVQSLPSTAVIHLFIFHPTLPVRSTRTYPRYIVVLMAQAKIYWSRENFLMVEKIFHKSVEVCTDDDTWKLNVAHVLFMQNKYKEAIGFYEPIVKKHYDDVSASECYFIGISVWALLLRSSDAALLTGPNVNGLPVCPGGAV